MRPAFSRAGEMIWPCTSRAANHADVREDGALGVVAG
jgi:hypothetical protein